MMFLLIIVIMYLIYLSIQDNRDKQSTSSITLLEAQFVEGKITEEEFLNRKRILLNK